FRQYVKAWSDQGHDMKDPQNQERAWRQAELDHMRASQNVLNDKLSRSESEAKQRADALAVEQERQWLTSTVQKHVSREEYVYANNDAGKEDVRAHLAL